jgi:cytochrome c biogenesis protein CcmG/thiol:disulfide interchange protein DsbE
MTKITGPRVLLSVAALSLLLWTACNLAPAPTMIDPTAAGRNPDSDTLGAQDFKLMDDKPAKLSDYKGKVVALDFWATYCPPCVAAMPDLEALHKQNSDKGLVILGLNVGGDEDRLAVPGFLQKNKINISYTLGYTMNSQTLNYYMGRDDRIPQTFVYDRQGKLVRHFVGYNAQIKKDLETAIQSALAQ